MVWQAEIEKISQGAAMDIVSLGFLFDVTDAAPFSFAVAGANGTGIICASPARKLCLVGGAADGFENCLGGKEATTCGNCHVRNNPDRYTKKCSSCEKLKSGTEEKATSE